MAKIQDFNGSSMEDGYKDDSKNPQPTKTDITKNKKFKNEKINAPIEGEPEDPHSQDRGYDRLDKFKDDEDFPVDTNAADVKRLINEHLAKLSKELRA